MRFTLVLFIAFSIIPKGSFAQNTEGTFKDPRDGKTYKTVTIGNQKWMAENLAFKINGYGCSYEHKDANAEKYGYLYNWENAAKGCPKGWHLPSRGDWDILFTNLDKIPENLKSKSGWENQNGTNSSGFNALPGGYLSPAWSKSINGVEVDDGPSEFHGIGSSGSWWTSDSDKEERFHHYSYGLLNGEGTNFSSDFHYSGYSVRCVSNDLVSLVPENGVWKDSRDGKTYKTVKIGKQIWMAENFAFKAGIGCFEYDNKVITGAKYGYLYDWDTAKRICPIGWHLPSDKEWNILINILGDKPGKKMKSIVGWATIKGKNGNGTNSSGFNALPGGHGNSHVVVFNGLYTIENEYETITQNADWWSSNGGHLSEGTSIIGNYFRLFCMTDLTYDWEAGSGNLKSVRYIKD